VLAKSFFNLEKAKGQPCAGIGLLVPFFLDQPAPDVANAGTGCDFRSREWALSLPLMMPAPLISIERLTDGELVAEIEKDLADVDSTIAEFRKPHRASRFIMRSSELKPPVYAERHTPVILSADGYG
jgi:hypothetical protein